MRSKVERAAALNLEALGRPAEAERHFREAVRLHRGDARPNEDPRIDYGAFLLRQGRPEEALRPLQQAAAAPASSARANTELGRVFLELGKPDAAAVQLERAITLEPGNWTARLLLGRAYLRLGRKQEGEEQMRLGQEGWARQHSDSSIVR
jgi:Tfp pilus assembly protein PilF